MAWGLILAREFSNAVDCNTGYRSQVDERRAADQHNPVRSRMQHVLQTGSFRCGMDLAYKRLFLCPSFSLPQATASIHPDL